MTSGGRRAGTSDTSTRDSSAAGRAADGRLPLSLFLFLFALPTSSLASSLFFGRPPFSLLLLLESLRLNLYHILACTAPIRIEDQSLVVLSLRKDAGPGIEKG